MDESRLKIMLEASPDMYLVIDRGGILVDFKPSRTFAPAGPPADFLGRPLSDVVHGDLAESGVVKMREVLDTGRESVLEYQLPVNGDSCFYEARF
ncbi:MAG: PAS domain-containing protein, partial [bacterium]